jgi:hypothetical protein
MVKHHQILAQLGVAVPIQPLQTLGDIRKSGRLQAWSAQRLAEWIDIIADGHSPQQGRLQGGGAPPHERVINPLAGLGQTFNKEARQLGLETGTIGNLMQRAGLPLPRSPKLVRAGWYCGPVPVLPGNHGFTPNGLRAKVPEGRKLLP